MRGAFLTPRTPRRSSPGHPPTPPTPTKRPRETLSGAAMADVLSPEEQERFNLDTLACSGPHYYPPAGALNGWLT